MDDGPAAALAYAEVLTGALAGIRAITGYAPLPGEPDIGPALEAAAARGAAVWLPVTVRGEPLWWAPWNPDDFPLNGPLPDTPLARLLGPRMRAHRSVAAAHDAAGGIELLDSAALAAAIDLLVLPALAVDQDGFRLGQGGGYYDRSFGPQGLADLGDAQAWACVGEDEILAAGAFPVNPYDLRCQAALTPGGVRRLRQD